MDIQTAKEIILASSYADDSVIIEGKHGIGKSNIVKQFAKENGYHIEELFLSHQEVGDLIGIPHMIEKDGTSITTWSVPIWLQRIYQKANQGIKTVLFLDELNRAPIDVRQSALQLVLERQIHEHLLPVVDGQRTLVVSAINPADEYQVDELDPALLDRFLHIVVEVDAPAWIKWAKSDNIDSTIIDFIAEHPDRLHWTPKDGRNGTTPRSWAKLSDFIVNADKIPNEILYQVFKGKLGNEIGSQFYTYYSNYVNVVKVADIEKIVEDNKAKVQNVDELADIIAEKIQKIETIQKTELAEQLRSKYKNEKNQLPLLSYLYALEVEISLAFLKGWRKDDRTSYESIVAFDTEINDKQLFKRIISYANKEQ